MIENKIKILFEHGSLCGKGSPYGVKIIALNRENKNYCEAVNNFPYLSKLKPKELDDLFNNLSFLISEVMHGTLHPEGKVHFEPGMIDREKYKDFLES